MFLRPKLIVNAALSLVVLVGVTTAYIIHTDLYLTGNKLALILFWLALAFGLFAAFQAIDELRWSGVAFSAAALLALAIVVSVHSTTDFVSAEKVVVEGNVSNIRHISFRETPNLYFISFDAVVPRSLLDKHLGVETTRFHEVFEENFRRFPNFFANGVRTTHSLSLLLALDEDIYASQRSELMEMGYDPNPFLHAGQNPSPLLEILHENDYETTFIYVDTFFGKHKGPYIDNYIIIQNNTVCHLLDDSIQNISFWGYCPLWDLTKAWSDWHTQVKLSAEQVTKVDLNDGPQFVMAHIYTPGHTNRSFRHDNADHLKEYRANYIEESEIAARHLELIVRHLKERDPNAILFVYGDHGAFVSNGLKYEDNPDFFFQDNYGILGGVYPRNACAADFDDAPHQGYMTILDAVHAILRCLSGGESALVEPRKYSQPVYGPIPRDAKPNFEEFLYE